MRVVFDTVVFVRALINPHGIWGHLVFSHSDQYRLVVSPPIVLEYLDVLARPELTRKFRTLETMDLGAVLAAIKEAEIADLISVPAISRDPKDDIFLATAAVAQAEYLVSEDRDLLDLKDHGPTRIVDAATFLRILAEASR
jgi:putative PIN family toxin of toxin-antitoxin system